jgi:hypothetical protein
MELYNQAATPGRIVAAIVRSVLSSACRATTAFASRIARASSPVCSKRSLATFAQSSFSSNVVALCVCLSASSGVHGICQSPANTSAEQAVVQSILDAGYHNDAMRPDRAPAPRCTDGAGGRFLRLAPHEPADLLSENRRHGRRDENLKPHRQSTKVPEPAPEGRCRPQPERRQLSLLQTLVF